MVSASYIADNYGTNMVYKTLYLNDIVNNDFEFTGFWWENTIDTFAFEYKPVEISLEELIRAWDDSVPFFMKLYTLVTTLEYLSNVNSIPTDDVGWTNEDGFIYVIVDRLYLRDTYSHYFDNPSYTEEQATILAMADLTENIRVDTWVITESTPDYQVGYNTGYQHGYNAGYQNGHNQGYNEGFSDGEIVGYNDGLDDGYNQGHADGYQEGFDIGYDIGYDDGLQVSESEAYDKGYMDGANESFIASLDKWIVPAIIIVMLVGGYFAIARKKREGDI